MMTSISTPISALARLLSFALILTVLVLWERHSANRENSVPRPKRWLVNFGMGALDTVVLRLMFPAGAVGAAVFANAHDVGLFRIIGFGGAPAILASVAVLDLAIYLQHRLFHVVPWFWRIHRVHHADPEVDVSTALRFHPVESVLSMLLKAGVVLAFGMPALAVLLFEIILNGAAMFNHANAALSRRIEPWVEWILVTPTVHRIHHSNRKREASRNFGFSVSWWDRLFRSYCAPSARGPVSIGLPDGPPSPDHVRLQSLLAMPFKG